MPAHRLNGGPAFLNLAGREIVVGAGTTHSAGPESGPTSRSKPGAGLPGTEVLGVKLPAADVWEK